MKIAIVGTGYVGLVTGALFADRGNKVICVDKNKELVEQLRTGTIHIYEPGLQSIVQSAIKRENLFFTSDLKEATKKSDIIFVAVDTPSNEDGSFNLTYVAKAVQDVAEALKEDKGYKIVVMKSTVPQGTYKKMASIIDEAIKNNPDITWDYVSNPETLAEGNAVSDFSKPDRVIVGTNSDKAFEIIEELYHPYIHREATVMRGTPAEAELAKLMANTALAVRISMVNEFARIVDKTDDADMAIIRRMVCADSRIGHKFMYPSPGYGGSCFPKDVKGLVHQAKNDGYISHLVEQVDASNVHHKNYLAQHVYGLLKKEKPHIAVWGLTFKPNTDDMRDAASIPIINYLLDQGAKIKAYDPEPRKAQTIFKDKITFVDDPYDAVKNADALLLLTEWKQFDSPDFDKLKENMDGNMLFDLRNRWVPKIVHKKGFHYHGVGRHHPLPKDNSQ